MVEKSSRKETTTRGYVGETMKAVIPAAGLGTRFLPATKAMPKEMLPVVDKPTIQYVVEEAIASDIGDILIITGRGKRAIEDHFDKSFELEYILGERNEIDLLTKVKNISDLADIHYIRQKEQKGLGDAVYCARKFIDNEPFAVLLGDDIVHAPTPCTHQLLDVYRKYHTSVVALEEVPKEQVSQYGIVQAEKVNDRLYKLQDVIEKPTMEEAPSTLSVPGRYILTPTIFECIEKTTPGKGNEIQLTDALRLLLDQEEIYGYTFEGRRYDVGNKVGYIKATLELALEREELGEKVREYLEEIKK